MRGSSGRRRLSRILHDGLLLLRKWEKPGKEEEKQQQEEGERRRRMRREARSEGGRRKIGMWIPRRVWDDNSSVTVASQ